MVGPGKRGPAPSERLPWAPLDDWRRPLGMAWLARRLGVSRERLYDWQSRGIPADRADAVAAALAPEGQTVDRSWLWKEPA
jgi:hypothetical protein